MRNNRILIIDDTPAIHEDFRKLLSSRKIGEHVAAFLDIELDECETDFDLESVFQGLDGVAAVEKAVAKDERFAVAFVDMRMPPGIDGLETVKRLWQVDPDILVVICTAFSDHTLPKIQQELVHNDHFLMLKKPFDTDEVKQLAASLVEKWNRSNEERSSARAQAQKLKSIEKSFNRNELYLELAAQMAGTGYCSVDTKSGEFVASERVCEVLGKSNAELDSWSRFIASICDADKSRVNKLFQTACACENGSFATTAQILTPDNRLRHVELSFARQSSSSEEAGFVFGVLHDISDSVNAINAAEYAKTHDALTTLPNRSMLLKELHVLAQKGSNSDSSAVVVVDVDSLRYVNQSFGEPQGDQLLQAIASRLTETVADTDMVARLGGDEFAIVHRGECVANETALLLERIYGEFAKPFEIENELINVNLSAGVALADANDRDFDRLISSAELALEKAKDDGKCCYRFFDDEMSQSLRERMVIESDLPKALRENHFKLNYQPIICCATSKTRALEALIRWEHPEFGFVPPDKFIEIAEQTNDIVPIGEWVLRQACNDILSFPESIAVSVNVSAVQLTKSDFPVTVGEVLMETGLAAKRLELEITERVLLTDNVEVVQTLNAIKRLGVKVVMDDFGVGYSSLSYLQKFAFDKLKLDRSFLPLSGPVEEAEVIVRAVASFGTSLNMITCAEGVETMEQFERIRREGYHQVQGYLFRRPAPVDEIREWVRANLDMAKARNHSLTKMPNLEKSKFVDV